ncbi:unnamed protein product [Lactuca virosa]|uniref:Uncharacterized protein n=1 Tax=Lactuca virosa TaxID=75947 RepID=A0AAU9ME55_9ASTR|nr:unnamed protein product [Lactuca virosa]
MLKVQRAAAGALRTLAFKNDENKNQILECNALPTLVLMLHSEDAAIHYEAVSFYVKEMAKRINDLCGTVHGLSYMVSHHFSLIFSYFPSPHSPILPPSHLRTSPPTLSPNICFHCFSSTSSLLLEPFFSHRFMLSVAPPLDVPPSNDAIDFSIDVPFTSACETTSNCTCSFGEVAACLKTMGTRVFSIVVKAVGEKWKSMSAIAKGDERLIQVFLISDDKIHIQSTSYVSYFKRGVFLLLQTLDYHHFLMKMQTFMTGLALLTFLLFQLCYKEKVNLSHLKEIEEVKRKMMKFL